jgi:hypothetical protein
MKYKFFTNILTINVAVIAMLIFVFTNTAKAFSDVSPQELFSTSIGTSTSSGGQNIGVFVDDTSSKVLKGYSMPASFAVDDTLNELMVLDSINNRIAIFSLNGQYVEDIKLPFNMRSVDFAWFPNTSTIVTIFQNKPEIGVLKMNTANGMYIENSSLFDVSKLPGIGGATSTILDIAPVDVSDASQNRFVVSILGTSTNPEFVQTSTGMHEVAGSVKKFSGSFLKDIVLGSNGIATSTDNRTLRDLRLAGVDGFGSTYLTATYVPSGIEDPVDLFVYGIDQSGSVTSKTQVFSSPQMLTNRYLYIDSQGAIYYMRADSTTTIGFYKFNKNENAASTSISSITKIPANMGIFSFVCPYISYTGNDFWILAGILAIILIIIGIISAAISHALISRNGGKTGFRKLLFLMLFAVLLCPALILWYIHSAPCSVTTVFATTNLLQNPGAETGNLAGWTMGGVSNPPVDDGTKDPGINPHGGEYDFWGGNGILGTLSQTVNLVGNQGITATMIDNRNLFASTSFWEQGLDQGTPSDDGSFSVAFLDASKNIISTTSSPVIDSHNLTWKNYAGQYAIPAGTRFITYTMNFLRNHGDNLDTFIDDNSLIVTNWKYQAK